jgi:hypothetical protein
MASLKAFLPQFSKQVGLSVDALYERQRALVRLGLMESVGRGPGGGTPARAETVAQLLTALLLVDGPSELDAGRFARTFKAPLQDRKRPICGLTKQKSFGAAVTCVLNETAIARKVNLVTLNRKTLRASLSWWRGSSRERTGHSSFDWKEEEADWGGLFVRAVMDGDVLCAVAIALSRENSDERSH